MRPSKISLQNIGLSCVRSTAARQARQISSAEIVNSSSWVSIVREFGRNWRYLPPIRLNIAGEATMYWKWKWISFLLRVCLLYLETRTDSAQYCQKYSVGLKSPLLHLQSALVLHWKPLNLTLFSDYLVGKLLNNWLDELIYFAFVFFYLNEPVFPYNRLPKTTCL